MYSTPRNSPQRMTQSSPIIVQRSSLSGSPRQVNRLMATPEYLRTTPPGMDLSGRRNPVGRLNLFDEEDVKSEFKTTPPRQPIQTSSTMSETKSLATTPINTSPRTPVQESKDTLLLQTPETPTTPSRRLFEDAEIQPEQEILEEQFAELPQPEPAQPEPVPEEQVQDQILNDEALAQQVQGQIEMTPEQIEYNNLYNQYQTYNFPELLKKISDIQIPIAVLSNPVQCALLMYDIIRSNRMDLFSFIVRRYNNKIRMNPQDRMFDPEFQNNLLLKTAISEKNYQAIDLLLYTFNVNVYTPESIIPVLEEAIATEDASILSKILTLPSADYGFINDLEENKVSPFANITRESKEEVFGVLMTELANHYTRDTYKLLFEILEPTYNMVVETLVNPNIPLNKNFYDDLFVSFSLLDPESDIFNYFMEVNVFNRIVSDILRTNQLEKGKYLVEKYLNSDLPKGIKTNIKLSILREILANRLIFEQQYKPIPTRFLRSIIQYFDIAELNEIKRMYPQYVDEFNRLYTNSIDDVWIKKQTTKILNGVYEEAKRQNIPIEQRHFDKIVKQLIFEVHELAPGYDLSNYRVMMQALSKLPDTLILKIMKE